MDSIELLSTDEIFNELKKRYQYLILIGSKPDKLAEVADSGINNYDIMAENFDQNFGELYNMLDITEEILMKEEDELRRKN